MAGIGNGCGRHMLVKRSRVQARDGVAKMLYARSSKHTLLQVNGEEVEVAEVKDTADMLLVRVQGVRKNQYIIQIDETKWEITKYLSIILWKV